MIPTVRLSSVISPSGTRAGADVSIPVYSVTKHRGFVPSLEYFNKQVYAKDLSTYKVVPEGDFAYATIHLDEGSIAIAPAEALISPMYTVFTPDAAQVDSNYLIRFLKSPTTVFQYATLGRGTAERRKSISLEALGRLSLPLPPLPEQRRIAEILDRADELRAMRRRALTLLDELADSIFAQTTCLETVTMSLRSAGIAFSSGKSLTAGEGEEHPKNRVLAVDAVSRGSYLGGKSKPLARDYLPPESHRIAAGDLLFTRASGSADLIGVSVFADATPDLFLPDKLWRVDFSSSSKIVPEYAQALFRHPEFRSFVRNESSGAAGVRNISQKKVLRFEVQLPTVAQQHQFAADVRRLDAVRQKGVAHLVMRDELFASLQHRAFKGQL